MWLLWDRSDTLFSHKIIKPHKVVTNSQLNSIHKYRTHYLANRKTAEGKTRTTKNCVSFNVQKLSMLII